MICFGLGFGFFGGGGEEDIAAPRNRMTEESSRDRATAFQNDENIHSLDH